MKQKIEIVFMILYSCFTVEFLAVLCTVMYRTEVSKVSLYVILMTISLSFLAVNRVYLYLKKNKLKKRINLFGFCKVFTITTIYAFVSFVIVENIASGVSILMHALFILTALFILQYVMTRFKKKFDKRSKKNV